VYGGWSTGRACLAWRFATELHYTACSWELSLARQGPRLVNMGFVSPSYS